MPMEVTIVDDHSESTMSAAEMNYRTSLQSEIMQQLRLKHGREFTAEKELRLCFGLGLSSTDEIIEIARLSGLVPPPRNF